MSKLYEGESQMGRAGYLWKKHLPGFLGSD